MRFGRLELSGVREVLTGRAAGRAVPGRGCKSTKLEVQN